MVKDTTIKLGFRADTAPIDKLDRKFVDVQSDIVDVTKEVDRLSTSLSKLHIPRLGGSAKIAVPTLSSDTPKHPELRGRAKIVVERLRAEAAARRAAEEASDDGGPGGSRGLGKVGGMLRTGGMIGLATLGIGGVVGTIMSAISKGKEYGITLGDLEKQSQMTGKEQVRFAGYLDATSRRYGVLKNEMLQYVKAYGSVAGMAQGMPAVQKQVDTASGFARGFGLDVGSTIQQYGGLAQAGAFGTLAGREGLRPEQFAALLAEAINRGEMQGREPELISSIQSLVSLQTQSLTRPENPSEVVNLLATMNQTGAQTNRPGLMGMRGTQLLSQMDSGIKNQKGGFGEYYLYRALGSKDYYDFAYQQEKGISDGNLEKIMEMVNRDFSDQPDPKVRWNAMGELLSITMHQAEAFDGVLKNLEPSTQSDFMKALMFAVGKEGKTLESLDPRKLSGIAEAFSMNTGEKQAPAVQRAVNAAVVKTPGDQTREVLASIDAWLTTKGSELVKGITKLATEGIAAIDKLSDGVHKLVEKLDEAYVWVKNKFGLGSDEKDKPVAGGFFTIQNDMYGPPHPDPTDPNKPTEKDPESISDFLTFRNDAYSSGETDEEGGRFSHRQRPAIAGEEKLPGLFDGVELDLLKFFPQSVKDFYFQRYSPEKVVEYTPDNHPSWYNPWKASQTPSSPGGAPEVSTPARNREDALNLNQTTNIFIDHQLKSQTKRKVRVGDGNASNSINVLLQPSH